MPAEGSVLCAWASTDAFATAAATGTAEAVADTGAKGTFCPTAAETTDSDDDAWGA